MDVFNSMSITFLGQLIEAERSMYIVFSIHLKRTNI